MQPLEGQLLESCCRLSTSLGAQLSLFLASFFLSSQDFDSDELIKLESLARLELVIAAKLGAKLV